jgi:hypothetical protein
VRRRFQQGTGAILGDLQKSHGSTGRRAESTFPGNSGRFWDVEKISEDRLADIHALANRGDFAGGNGLGARGELMGARGDFADRVIRALLHAGEEIVEAEIRNFIFFWHNRI